MKANSIISALTALLVLFLAGAAFVLSYDALYNLALDNGIGDNLAWLWPLTLDAVMIAASLSVLRAGLNKEKTWYAWVLVGAFTALSITFNVLHADATWLARAVYALPPLVVFLSFELLMTQTKNSVRHAKEDADRQVHIDNIKKGLAIPNNLTDFELYTDVKKGTAAWKVLRQLVWQRDNETCLYCAKGLSSGKYHCHHVKPTYKKGKGKPSNLVTLCPNCHAKEHANDTGPDKALSLAMANDARLNGKQEAMDALLTFYADNPGASYAEAGRHIQRARQTVKGYVDELIDAGRLEKNGAGVEVTG